MPSPPSAFPNCSCFVAIFTFGQKEFSTDRAGQGIVTSFLSLNNASFSVVDYASKKNTSTSLLPHYSQTPWQANIGYLLIKGM